MESKFNKIPVVTGDSRIKADQLTDAEKLRALADWFDDYDERTEAIGPGSDEVQQDLRRIATKLEN